MEKVIQTSCPGLPKGWIKEVVPRKSGASVGRSDIYYYSPEGVKCRSKPQMLQYLPEDFDIDNFNFRDCKMVENTLRARKRRKENFHFGKDFTLATSMVKPRRQTKKAKDSIQVNVKTGKDVEGDKNENRDQPTKKTLSSAAMADQEIKKKHAENLSQRLHKPKQLFWQRRLQHVVSINRKTMKPCHQVKINDKVKDLLPGSDNKALVSSLSYALFSDTKVNGQHASLNALRKHPTALVNTDQPFTAAITITDEQVRQQERVVESVRRRLAEAQDLLKALAQENEEEEDEENEMEE